MGCASSCLRQDARDAAETRNRPYTLEFCWLESITVVHNFSPFRCANGYRTVRSRAIFSPEDDVERKPRSRGRGGKTKKVEKVLLESLLEDEEAVGDQGEEAGKGGGCAAGEGQR